MSATDICGACGDTRANHEHHFASECQEFRSGRECALSPEERAERAWATAYPINTDLHRIDSMSAEDVKEGFVAGYLAALKELAK